MRPELDATQFIQFNYWDSGHQGLLSGEALYLDIKRMEMAYHDNNKRELELTRHVSLRQLDPLALLALRITGSCTVTVPEWLYDRDCPGHYMRRIKNVSLSVPSVVGPYTSVNCTLSLQSSTRARLAAARQRHLRARHHAGRRPLRRLLRRHRHRSSPAAAPTTAGCSRPTCGTSGSCPSRAPARSAPGTCRCPPQLRPSTTRRSPTSSCTSATPRGRRATRSRAQATKELIDDARHGRASSQALLFCLRYDFPTAVVGVRQRHRELRRHAGEAVLPLRGAGRQEADHRRADAVRGQRGNAGPGHPGRGSRRIVGRPEPAPPARPRSACPPTPR